MKKASQEDSPISSSKVKVLHKVLFLKMEKKLMVEHLDSIFHKVNPVVVAEEVASEGEEAVIEVASEGVEVVIEVVLEGEEEVLVVEEVAEVVPLLSIGVALSLSKVREWPFESPYTTHDPNN